MLKPPMETSGEYRIKKNHVRIGDKHPDGHVNFFSPRTYEKLLDSSHLDVIEHRLIETIVPTGAKMVMVPENDTKSVGLLKALRRPKSLLGRALRSIPFIPFEPKGKFSAVAIIYVSADRDCLTDENRTLRTPDLPRRFDISTQSIV